MITSTTLPRYLVLENKVILLFSHSANSYPESDDQGRLSVIKDDEKQYIKYRIKLSYMARNYYYFHILQFCFPGLHGLQGLHVPKLSKLKFLYNYCMYCIFLLQCCYIIIIFNYFCVCKI